MKKRLELKKKLEKGKKMEKKKKKKLILYIGTLVKNMICKHKPHTLLQSLLNLKIKILQNEK